MKLVFPNGECEQTELKAGDNIIGKGEQCDIRIDHEQIADHHCTIQINSNGATISVKDATNITRVNGSLVAARTPVNGGDALLFGTVQAQLAGSVGNVDVPDEPEQESGSAEDESRTRVRMAIPKFVLRGVSGSTFGKNFAVHGAVVVGRHSECDICLPSEEISRKHAKISVASDGLYVEDLGSSNGTFVNGKQVKRAKVEPGDELKLDTVRFLVQAPGMDTPAKKPEKEKPAAPEEPEETGGGGAIKWVIIGVIVVGAAVAAAMYMGVIPKP